MLLVPVLLVNLGVVPLYVEEPRRAVVALEMMYRGNWLVPTINGEYYYLKPPFFNWLLASVYKLTGNAGEFNTRITSVISLLMLGVVIWWTGKKYVSPRFGILSALLFVTASGNLFFNSLLAEIDLFYSLVTYTSLVVLFHLHQRKKYYLLFAIFYFLAAIGTLTKGLPSLVFAGLSLLIYFAVIREFRRLFTLPHFLGIGTYLVLVGGYFLAYDRHGNALTYLANLTFESGKRLSTDTLWNVLGHLFLYPLDTLWNLLPASLLIIFVFRKSLGIILRENALIRFALLMLLIHFPVYWLPPGGRQRYIIMLYPFIIQVLVFLYLKGTPSLGRGTESLHKYLIFDRLLAVLSGLAALACLAPVFLSEFSGIKYLLPLCLAAFIALFTVFVIQWKQPRLAIAGMIFSLLVLRMMFNLLVLPERAQQGAAFQNKQMAGQIMALTGGARTGIYPGTDFPMQAVYYFERERRQILPLSGKPAPGDFLIVEKSTLEPYQIYREPCSGLFSGSCDRADPTEFHQMGILTGHVFEVAHEWTIQRKKNHRSHFLLIHIPDE